MKSSTTSTNVKPPAKKVKLSSSAHMHRQPQQHEVFPLTRLPTDIGATAFEFLQVVEMCALARACAPLRTFAKTALRRPRATLVCTMIGGIWPVDMALLEHAAAACPRAARIRLIDKAAGAKKPAFVAAPLSYAELVHVARMACAPYLRELSVRVYEHEPLIPPQPRAFPRLEVVRLHIEHIHLSTLFDLAQEWEEHAPCIEFLTDGCIGTGALMHPPEPTAREVRALRKVSRLDIHIMLMEPQHMPFLQCAAALVALVRLLPQQCAVRVRVGYAEYRWGHFAGDLTRWDRFARAMIDALPGRFRATQMTRRQGPEASEWASEWLFLSSDNYGGTGYSDVDALNNMGPCCDPSYVDIRNRS